MACISCGKDLIANAKFCRYCGVSQSVARPEGDPHSSIESSLLTPCNSCGSALIVGARFCKSCGTSVLKNQPIEALQATPQNFGPVLDERKVIEQVTTEPQNKSVSSGIDEFSGEKFLTNDAFKIFLSKKYNIKKNDLFNKFGVNDTILFDTLDQALLHAFNEEALTKTDTNREIASDERQNNVTDAFAQKRQEWIDQQALKDIEKKESTELSNIENNVPEKKRLALNIKKSQGVFIFNNRTFGTLDLAIEYAEKNIAKEDVKTSESNLSRNRIIIFLILLLIAPVVWYYSQTSKVKEVTKPSFDCLKAKTPTELKICNEPTLAKLDIENADLYKKAKEIEPLQTKQILKDSNKKRNNCNGEYKCIVSNYEQSINEYKSLINGYSSTLNPLSTLALPSRTKQVAACANVTLTMGLYEKNIGNVQDGDRLINYALAWTKTTFDVGASEGVSAEVVKAENQRLSSYVSANMPEFMETAVSKMEQCSSLLKSDNDIFAFWQRNLK